jgi:hypothetical protein
MKLREGTGGMAQSEQPERRAECRGVCRRGARSQAERKFEMDR